MNTGVVNLFGMMTGIKGSGNISSNDILADGVSFEEVFMQAAGVVNAAEETVPNEDAFSGEEEEQLSFSETLDVLKEKLNSGNGELVNAAVEALQSIGRAVEILMGTVGESESGEESEEGGTLAVFDFIIKLLPEKNDENANEVSDVLALLGNIADALQAGLKEGELSPEEIVSQITEALETDSEDTENTLAQAFTTLVSAIQVSSSDEASFTASDIEKVSKVIIEVTESKAPQDIAKAISDILSGKDMQNVSDKPETEFIDFISRNNMRSFKTDTELKINDAAVQLESIVRNSDSVSATKAVYEDGGDVYKELWTIASKQLASQITREYKAPDFNGVKELTVVLRPESLGEVAVKLTTDVSGRVSLILAASNAEIGRALTENAAALGESLSRQNMNVSNVNVINPSEASSYMGLDFTNQSFNRKNDGGENDGQNNSARKVNAVENSITADDIRAQKLLKEAKLWATA